MASILQVEEIKGPTSGINANKVKIQDGSTFEYTPVSGGIVQTKIAPYTPTFDTTTNSYITQASTTFTPKFSDSIIIVEWSGHVYKYNTASGGNSPARLMFNGRQFWQNNYLMYTGSSASEYMTAAYVRGSGTADTTNTVEIVFQISAGTQGHQYVYGNSSGLKIIEVRP